MKQTLAAWVFAGVLAGAAFAQPGNPPPDKSQPEQRADGRDRQDVPDDPALAKKWVERRLEETVKREERLRAALKELDKGKAPADVLKDVEPRREAAHDNRKPGEAEQPRNHGEHAQARKITPEERAQALKFLHESSATLGTRFDDLIKKDPDMADRILGHMLGRIREALTAKEKGNERLYKLRVDEMEGGAALVDAMRAYRDVKNLTPPDAAKLNQATEALRVALTRQLDNRLSWQANEIESLSKRLADMKTDLERKQASRTATIDSLVTKVREGKDLRELRPEPESSDQPSTTPPPPPPPGAGAPGSRP